MLCNLTITIATKIGYLKPKSWILTIQDSLNEQNQKLEKSDVEANQDQFAKQR